MNPHTRQIPPTFKIYDTALNYLRSNPYLFIPFVIFFILDFGTLIMFFLAPRMPMRPILGPIISRFWHERFLHYPLNFIVLPEIAARARMILSVFLGSLLAGVAVILVANIYHKKHLNPKEAYSHALNKYFQLLSISFIYTFLFYLATKLMAFAVVKYFVSGHSRFLFIGPRIWTGPILLLANFFFAVLIQSAFIYAVPALLIDKLGFFKSLLKGFVVFKKLFIRTLFLIGLPMLAYIPVIILNYNPIFLMDKFFPEAILLFAILGAVINSLFIDSAVVISTAYLYLWQKDNV